MRSAGEEWAETIKSAAQESGAPSVQWHASFGDLEISSGATGLSIVESSTEATSETLYRIGSISKLFTTVLLYQLADQNKIGLDDRLVKYLPDFAVFDPFDNSYGRGITLRHLANHLSGLGRSCPLGMDDLVSSVNVLKSTAGLVHPTGTTAQYSNPAFTMLGQTLAEVVMDSTFSEALSSLITSPLGISSGTGVDYSESVLNRLASSYLNSGQNKDDFIELGFNNPAGGMYSTAKNLTSLLQALGGAYAGDNSPKSTVLGISPFTMRDFLKMTWQSNDASFQQGTPWEMFLSDYGYLVRGKDGVLGGFTSYIGFVPELSLSVAMLFNGPPNDLQSLAKSTFSTLIPPLVEALNKVQPGPDPGSRPADYVGYYECTDPSLSGNVTYVNSVLEMRTPLFGTLALPLAAVPGAMDMFTFYIDPVTSSGQTCSFLFSSNAYGYATFSRELNGGISGFTIPMISPGTNWTRV